MSTTYESVVEAICERVFAGKSGSDKITLTGGSTSTAIAASLVYSSGAANSYDGVGIFCVDSTDDLAPKGEFSWVTSGGYAGASGTFTLSPVVTAAYASGDSILLFRYGIDHLTMMNAASHVATSHFWPRLLPLSLEQDGDMEGTDATYPAVVSGATVTRVTTASRALLSSSRRIQGAGDGQGGRWPVMNVFGGSSLRISVAVMCDTGTAEIELYDADTSAVISGTSYKTDEEGFAEVRFTYTPSSQERIQVQVTQDGSTALDAYVGWVIVQGHQQESYPLPSSIAKPQDIRGYMALPLGQATGDDNSYAAWQKVMYSVQGQGHTSDYFAANVHRIEIPTSNDPVFIDFRAKDAPITSLTSILYGEVDAIVYGAAARLAEIVKDRMTGRYRREWEERQREWGGRYGVIVEGLDLVRPETNFVDLVRVPVP